VPLGPAGPPIQGTSAVGAFSSSACNAVGTPTPSAILIPIANPNGTLANGGNLTVTYELEGANYTGSGVTVVLPSLFATFPLSSSGSLSDYFSPRSVALSGSGWTNGSATTRTIPIPSGASFASGRSAVLSTQKLAVMATAGYGQLTLEVRWHWVVRPTGASTTTGAWSTPTSQAHWPSSVPSIFFPAPYATDQSPYRSTDTIGSNYTVVLGQAIAARSFFLELEYARNGTVVQSVRETAPAGASTFTVGVVLLNYDSFLAPATFLVHIHDECGALLYSLAVKAVFAAHATVGFSIQPSRCGSITFGGSSYSSGSSGTFTPSTTPYSFALPACSGLSFHSWQTSGGLHITSASTMRVSSNGTFAVTYA
jgi:hypothetical protein